MNKSAVITLGSMVLIIVLVLGYIFFLRDESEVQKSKQTPAAAALLPDDESAAFKTLTGEPAVVGDAFGGVMVVTTWASWCPQCAADFPKLGEVAAEFKDKGVTVMAINRGEDVYSAERYLATIQKPEHVQFLLDETDYFFNNSGGYAMPETVVYNADGEVVLELKGEFKIEDVKAILRSLTE